MVLRSDDFTEQGQHVLSLSSEIVRRYNHTQWDVEHILLALLEIDDGVAVEVLRKLGVAVDGVRRPRGGHPRQCAPRSPRDLPDIRDAKGKACSSQTPRRRLSGSRTSTWARSTSFIAVTEVKDGDAPAVLREFGVSREQVYKALMEVRGGHRVTDQRAEKPVPFAGALQR